MERTFLAFIARSCEGPTCPEDQGAYRIIGPSSDHHDLQLRSVADVEGYWSAAVCPQVAGYLLSEQRSRAPVSCAHNEPRPLSVILIPYMTEVLS
jgi:hypothetical protein